MTSEVRVSIADRLLELLDRLDIERSHVVGGDAWRLAISSSLMKSKLRTTR